MLVDSHIIEAGNGTIRPVHGDTVYYSGRTQPEVHAGRILRRVVIAVAHFPDLSPAAGLEGDPGTDTGGIGRRAIQPDIDKVMIEIEVVVIVTQLLSVIGHQ